MQNLTQARKTVIITGANSGLGYYCAEAIARSGQDWHIVIASRNLSRVEEAVRTLVAETNYPHIEGMVLDLASLVSVRQIVVQQDRGVEVPIITKSIAKNNEVITVIVIFTVKPEQQQELIDTIIRFSETVKQQPGFVSASLHKSLDGVKVANYAQWKSQSDYSAFVNNSEVQAHGSNLSEFPRPDAHVYEVVISESKAGIPKISKGGFLTHFAEFRMEPENQQRMVDLAKEEVVIAMQQPGLTPFPL